MSYSTRFGRQVTRKRHFDEVTPPIESKTQPKLKKSRAQPTVNALTDAADLTQRVIRQKAHFTPPIQVEFDEWTVNWPERDPVALFLRFLGAESLTAIVNATNTYAEREYAKLKENVYRPRPWRPLSRGEFLQWLGILFYMGRHIEKCRQDYWRNSIFPIHKTRWDQIHRFLAFNAKQASSDTAPFSFKLEPVATNIRNNCRAAVSPSSWVAVDELIISFTGRSVHKTSIKHKPIPEGFKV